jgi:hypothetical protein
MDEKENLEEIENGEFDIPQVPRECVKFPPPLNEEGIPLQGRVYNVECPDTEGCGWWGDIETDYGQFLPEGLCPDCGKELRVDFSRQAKTVGIGTRGAGYHSTAWGRRRKQEMIRRNKKLERKQWENVPTNSVVNPERIVNPTPGGIYDPRSIFNKDKRKPAKVIYKKD